MSMNPELPENCTLKIARYDELTDAQYDELASMMRASFAEYASNDINMRGVTANGPDLRQELTEHGETLFLLYQGDSIVAYAKGHIVDYAGDRFLACEGVAVHPEFRRGGIGKLLATHREEWSKEQGATFALLGTAVKAKKAVAFHHRNGYKDWRYSHSWNRNYYSIFMRKDYGKPYPTLRRLAKLYVSWLLAHLTYSEKGSKRPMYYIMPVLKKLLRRG